jgi:tRNA A37 threonylcarbamoyladenosine modification protein TsaB
MKINDPYLSYRKCNIYLVHAVNVLKMVQRVMHNNVVSPRSLDVVFKRIGFAIQQGLAAQLDARLSSIQV